MKAFIFGDKSKLITSKVIDLCISKNIILSNDIENVDLGIAPLLTEKIPDNVLNVFRHGVLIFHPSLLPMHGGPNAIKKAFSKNAYYSGITWFWGNSCFDAGDICEQSAFRIDSTDTPKSFYENKCIPEALRMLDYALDDIRNGIIRKRKQNKSLGSYEKKEL